MTRKNQINLCYVLISEVKKLVSEEPSMKVPN